MDVLIYDKATGNGIKYIPSVNTPDYAGKEGVFPDISKEMQMNVSAEYVKVSGTTAREMNAEEKAAVDTAKPPPEPNPLDAINEELLDHEGRIKKLETPVG